LQRRVNKCTTRKSLYRAFFVIGKLMIVVHDGGRVFTHGCDMLCFITRDPIFAFDSDPWFHKNYCACDPDPKAKILIPVPKKTRWSLILYTMWNPDPCSQKTRWSLILYTMWNPDPCFHKTRWSQILYTMWNPDSWSKIYAADPIHHEPQLLS